MHSGLEVIEVDASHTANPPPHFDQGESLVHLRVFIRDGQAHPTLYVHHALADGHHMYGLIEELLSFYTDLVTNGKTGPVTANPRRSRSRPCSPTGVSRRVRVRASSGSCRRCSPMTFRRRGEVTPARNPRRPCGFRWCHADSARADACHRRALPRREAGTALRALGRDPDRGVAGARRAEHPGAVHLHRRSAVLPVAAGVGDRMYQPGRAGHLPGRDQPEDHGGRAGPRHRCDVQGRPGRRRDPAVPSALQPAVRRQRAGHARRCVVVRQRFGAAGAHATPVWR